MENLFASFDTAKKLKGAGFNEPCFKYYGVSSRALLDLVKGNETVKNEQFINDPEEIWVTAPLYQQIIRWFLDKDISILVFPIYYDNAITVRYSFEISRIGETIKNAGGFKAYDEALNEAINQALKLI